MAAVPSSSIDCVRFFPLPNLSVSRFSKKDVLDFSALESVLAEVASARERPEVGGI